METRSGRRRRLSSQPPCCQGGDGGGEDHISRLHDDLLIQVLVRLRCAAAAARTSVLSRRWRQRGLWKHLPKLSFSGIAHGALEAALAQVSLPNLSLLDIEITDKLPAEAVASLLRTAARLDPAELSIVIAWVAQSDESVPIEVPSFPRATSIRLRLHNLYLTLPAQGGEFPVLETLSITSGRFDTVALISRCPHLRVLELIYCWGIGTITVHSETLEELLVISEQLRGVDIAAPMLKKFTLRCDVSVDFTMSLLAPTVENLSWKCWSHGQFLSTAAALAVGIDDDVWRLVRLELGTEGSSFTLGLDIELSYHSVLLMRNLQEMFALPKISVLELCLDTRGDVYGSMVPNLLRIWNAIQRLKLVIKRAMWRDEGCPPNCPCYQVEKSASQNISLMDLEEVEIENFKGSAHEVHLLEILFRCAPLTKVTVKLASSVVPSSRGCKKAYKLFQANPAVECHVYLKRGNDAVYSPYAYASRCSWR